MAKDWPNFLQGLRGILKPVEKMMKLPPKDSKGNTGNTAERTLSPELREKWKQFAALVTKFESQLDKAKNNFAFSFVEGPLIKAVREGHWVLLDEMNLASAETLEVTIWEDQK
jgi:midasin